MPSTDAQWQAFCLRLFHRNEQTIKLGLDRVRDALGRLGAPQLAFRVCTVAGTNGKGTCAALTAWWLARAGVRVGLYTSPHLVDFTERFRVDGAPVPRALVMRCGQRVLAQCPELTFFEVTTAIALLAFAELGVEVAVLEVGLGGRLDAVNAVNPVAVGVTSIALDHQAYLGDTLEAVAREKAGVFRAGVPAVIAPQPESVRAVLASEAERIGAVVTQGHPQPALPEWLRGQFEDNVAVAAALAGIFGVTNFGVDGFRWPARRDEFLDGFILDVAHNPAGAASLAEYLGLRAPAFGILGVSADKDAAAIAAALAPLRTRWVLTSASSPRAMTVAALAAAATPALDVAAVTPTVAEAIGSIPAGTRTLVTGSVYVIGDLLRAVAVDPEFFSLSCPGR